MPKGPGLFILFYLLLTTLFYGDFLPFHITSRLPLIISTITFFPLALLNWKYQLNEKVLFWGSGFLLLNIINSCLHFNTNSNEINCILSSISIIVFYSFIQNKDVVYLKNSLIVSLGAYILIFYVLAFANGMVGVSDSGSFVHKILPTLDRFIMNYKYPSSRGTFGLFGGSLFILTYFSKRTLSNKVRYILNFISLFSLLVSDSRGVISSFLFVLTIMIIPIPKTLKTKAIYFLPLLVFLIQPIFFINIDYLIEQTITFKRENQQGEERIEIWAFSLIMIFTSTKHFFLGYGEIEAGEILLSFFRGGQEEFDAAHNLLLQLMLNGGLFLVLSFVIMLIYI